MSRGAVTGKSVAAHIDAFTWLSNVKVGNKRGGSSGAGSTEPNSSSSSRINSRQPSLNRADNESGRHRSVSRSRGTEDRRENIENTQTLQDEITGALNRLASSKIKLEKIDLTKKRTCTLGLHGPWGERSSVFMRVTFTFPARYPQPGPEGTPLVELERSPLISIRDRAYILKRLRVIRERKRPCLEPCLRFLLFAEEDHEGRGPAMDSESSDDERDEKDPNRKMKKEFTMSILRNHKNLAEPRTSQGTFGPNGELVCFFRAPPRMFQPVARGLTVVPSMKTSQADETPHPTHSGMDTPNQQSQQQQSRLFQSPALVADALRRLSLAAKDRVVQPIDSRRPENDLNILRTMTNLLTVSQHKIRRDSLANGGSGARGVTTVSTRRSNVFIEDTSKIAGPDKLVAEEYIFAAKSIWEYCEKNAEVARDKGRFDHERVFKTLQSLLRAPEKTEVEGVQVEVVDDSFLSDMLAIEVIMQIYSDLAAEKDLQMLAMLSVVVLKTPHGAMKAGAGANGTSGIPTTTPYLDIMAPGISRLPPIKTTGFDYFSLARSINNMPSPMSPAWQSASTSASSATTADTPSPVGGGPPPSAPSVASSNSSTRGSWSSLFNTLLHQRSPLGRSKLRCWRRSMRRCR